MATTESPPQPPNPNPQDSLILFSGPSSIQFQPQTPPPPPPSSSPENLPPPSSQKSAAFGLFSFQKRPPLRVTTEFDSESSVFFHKVSSKLFNGLAKLKFTFHNNPKGEVSEPQIALITKHLAIHYDVEEQNALVKGFLDVGPNLKLKAAHNIQARQGEVSLAANLSDPGYKFELATDFPSIGLPKATLTFPCGEVSLVEKDDEDLKRVLSVSGIAKGSILNGLCTAVYCDETLKLRYSYKDDEMSFIPSISLPSNAVSFAFKRRFGPSDKLSYWYDFDTNYWSTAYKHTVGKDYKFKAGYDSEVRLGWASLWVGDEGGKAKAAPMKMKVQFMLQVPQDDIKSSVLMFRVKKRTGSPSETEEPSTSGRCTGETPLTPEKEILQATTEAEYDRALDNFKDAYQWCPAIVDYVMQQWVPQREKFVKYWTNQVLHFGNTTTCRVESAHRALKDWIDSSTSALDTLFERINKAIDTQRNGIKNSLEDSRRRHGTMYSHFIFKILHGRVSHYCLGLILSEHTRMRELGDEVAIRCGCAISVTHGLPCACTIHRVITQDRASLHVDQVHPFWRTLVIGEHAVPQTVNREQEELEQFRSMFDQVSSSHPSVIRSATHVLHDMFNSSCLDHEEPEGVERPRGRQPRRERSAFEYIRGRGRGRGRGRTSSSSGSQTSSSVNMPGTGRMDIEHFPYKDRIPNIMMPFLDGWNDVVADGNCGFRVVADVFQMGEDNYGLVRQLMYSEIASNRAVYRHVYGQDLDRSLQRIRWGGGRCGQNHWFDAPLDLFAVANIYKCAVMHFGLGLHGRAYYPCTTVLPWCSRETVTRPVREVAIGFLGPSYRHFIRLDLSPDFPVPPIIPTWYTIRTASVEGWDALYHDRVQQWNNLVAFSM